MRLFFKRHVLIEFLYLIFVLLKYREGNKGMIFDSCLSLIFDDVFLRLDEKVFGSNVFLKMEGFSCGGSVKMKPAARMISDLEDEHKISPGSQIIESSSGNLGVALSIVCAKKGYDFTCVVDLNTSPSSIRLMKAYGAKVVVITQKDENGGYLKSRIDYIELEVKKNPNLIWTNQYSNVSNIYSHYDLTGRSILSQFKSVDYVYVGAGTTGTLGGVSTYLRENSPDTNIIAVDSVGSVTFGGPPKKRKIPGLGTSISPPISAHSSFDRLEMVKESDAILMCRKLAKEGILLGGSSGTVLHVLAAEKDIRPPDSITVAISPDLGERYCETIYNDNWLLQHFPEIKSIVSAEVSPIEACV